MGQALPVRGQGEGRAGSLLQPDEGEGVSFCRSSSMMLCPAGHWEWVGVPCWVGGQGRGYFEPLGKRLSGNWSSRLELKSCFCPNQLCDAG